MDYRMRVSYYRGRDGVRRKGDGSQARAESEIDLIIEDAGILHPLEIKLTANPKASMITAFKVLDKIPSHKRGDGAIICMYDRPLHLSDTVRAIPVNYI